MKHKLIILMGLSALLTSCGNSWKYHYETYGLDRPVKSIKMNIYEATSKFGDVMKGDLEGVSQVTFNEVGNIETIKRYDGDGDLDGVIKYKYNANNMAIEMSQYDSDGDITIKQTYEYDGDYICSWSTSNRLYNDTPSINTTTIQRDGEKIIETTSTYNGEHSGSCKYTRYDKKRHEWTVYDKDGNETGQCYEEFDKNGNITKMCTDGVVREVEWKGNIPVKLKNAEPFGCTIFWSSNNDESIMLAEYEFDEKGNWITQTIFEGEDKKPIRIIERTINY